jgi:putative transposase
MPGNLAAVFKERVVLQVATLTYIDWFNNRRIHNEIGKISPARFEAAYYRQFSPVELVSSQQDESP